MMKKQTGPGLKPKYPELAAWMNAQWFAWQKQEYERTGNKPPQGLFAKYLNISPQTLSNYMSGKQSPSRETAMAICTTLNDASLLAILGYLSLEGLPRTLRFAVAKALLDIEETLRTRDIPLDSPEAERIAKEILESLGSK